MTFASAHIFCSQQKRAPTLYDSLAGYFGVNCYFNHKALEFFVFYFMMIKEIRYGFVCARLSCIILNFAC